MEQINACKGTQRCALGPDCYTHFNNFYKACWTCNFSSNLLDMSGKSNTHEESGYCNHEGRQGYYCYIVLYCIVLLFQSSGSYGNPFFFLFFVQMKKRKEAGETLYRKVVLFEIFSIISRYAVVTHKYANDSSH